MPSPICSVTLGARLQWRFQKRNGQHHSQPDEGDRNGIGRPCSSDQKTPATSETPYGGPLRHQRVRYVRERQTVERINGEST